MARYALIVGISEYKSKHLKNLSKPVQDAEAIADVLERYGQFDTKPMVLKGKVVQAQLVAALRTFLEKQAVNSDTFIYFTGHGISVQDPFGDQGQGYLATSDTEVKVKDGQVVSQERAIPFTSLNNLIQKANLSSLVMLVDACHSGDFVSKAAYEQSFSSFNNKSDCLLISACRDFEEALAKKSEDHSLFTGAVLEALVADNADRTGAITSGRLADELKLTLKGSPQRPEAYGKGLGLKIIEFPHEEWIGRAVPNMEQGSTVLATNLSTVPRQMPPLPSHFVERPTHQEAIKARLLCEDGTESETLVVSAIHGLGGIGKSVLASKLAHDEEIQTHFSDGILWATLGQNPDILPTLSGWIQALGDYDYKPTAIESASTHLRTLLYGKRALLVVDDVWNPNHLEPFRVGGKGSCILVTTREAKVPDSSYYDLDVMDESQSLALMTQKLSEPLDAVTHKYATTFAKRVGYLPLALELAASQIEEGVTWQELLSDLNAEVSRLESLNIYEQEKHPDGGQQRKYSLIACFNLSLKQLSNEQLSQFAWLGIVPEDVKLTEAMAQTLWQVTSRQSRSILRNFKSKALVLQGAQQPNDLPSYRMHDLMHDLAQRLLLSPSQPVHSGQLPGLGLTKTEAHCQLLKRYRDKTEDGQWHTLADDGYIYAHLTWHMEQASQFQSIHELLKASNEAGRNGWYEACESIAKPAVFAKDIGRGWQLAVKNYGKEPGKCIALLFRYALIRSSLNSLANNVPSQLVGALIDKGLWQVSQGLAYAQQAQEPRRKEACISAISPYIKRELLPEVVKTISHIDDVSCRTSAFSKLAEIFPEVWPNVLENISLIPDFHGYHRYIREGFDFRYSAIKEIAKYLPHKYVSKAVEIAHQIQNLPHRSVALIALSTKRTELFSEVVEAIKEVKIYSDRTVILREITEQLPSILSLTVKREKKCGKDSCDPSYTSEFNQSLLEILPSLIEVRDRPKVPLSRYEILCTLGKNCPDKLPEILQMACEVRESFFQPSALNYLINNLPELLPESLKIASQIQRQSSQASVLRELSEYLPTELIPESFEMLCQIRDRSSRASVLKKLSERLPAELLPKALDLTRQIQSESSWCHVLFELTEHFPDLLPEALEVARQIEDESSRALALSKLAKYLPDLSPEALEVARQIEDESSQALALVTLTEYFPSVLPEALRSIHQIDKPYLKASALGDIAEYLTTELWPEALNVTRQIKDAHHRGQALGAFGKYLPAELWPEILSIVRQTEEGYYQSIALDKLAKYVPAKLCPEALAIAYQIDDTSSRLRVLAMLSKSIPELMPEVKIAVGQIRDNEERASVLCELANRIPDLWFEALTEIEKIKDESSQSSLLESVAEYIPEESWPDTLALIDQLKDESHKSSLLRNVFEHVPEDLLTEVVELANSLKNRYFRAISLQKFLPYISQQDISFSQWESMLDTLSYRERDEFLKAIPHSKCIVTRFGRDETFSEVLQAVREVCRQWN